MKQTYLFVLCLACLTQLSAQAPYTISSAPVIGDSWTAVIFADFDGVVTYPIAEANGTYDFTALGDLINEDDSLRLRDIPQDQQLRFEVVDPDDFKAENPALQALPEEAIGLTISFPEAEFEMDSFDFDFEFANFGELRTDGFYSLVDFEITLDFNTEEISAEFVLLDTAELVFPFGLGFGDSIRTTTTELSTDFGFPDSTVTNTTWEYVGYGSMTTYFGTFNDVVIIESRERSETFADVTNTGNFMLFQASAGRSLFFLEQGNFLPIVQFDYFGPLQDPAQFDAIDVTITQRDEISGVAERDAADLRLTTFPNPASARLHVNFKQEAAAPVSLRLLDLSGREVATRQAGTLAVGDQRTTLEVPTDLPAGHYFLQLQSGKRTTGKPVVIRR